MNCVAAVLCLDNSPTSLLFVPRHQRKKPAKQAKITAEKFWSLHLPARRTGEVKGLAVLGFGLLFQPVAHHFEKGTGSRLKRVIVLDALALEINAAAAPVVARYVQREQDFVKVQSAIALTLRILGLQ